MSTYVREKVLRIPADKIKLPIPADCDDWNEYMEDEYPEIFGYAEKDKFQFSPTTETYIDYVLEREYDADGEYGRTRALSEREKAKYLSVFQKLDPDVNMDYVRLVEFCWYNCCEAPDYYDETKDAFYEEV